MSKGLMVENGLIVLKRKSLIDRVIDCILISIMVISFIILILCLYIIIQKKIFPDEVPSIFGVKPFIVISGSMRPVIKEGDIIFVKEIDIERLNTNDVIAFRYAKEESVMVHRICEKNIDGKKIYFKTKGDANGTEDRNKITNENIEGIYFYRIPLIGRVALFIRSKEGIIFSILVILVIFLIWQVFKIKRNEKLMNKRLVEYKEILEEGMK